MYTYQPNDFLTVQNWVGGQPYIPPATMPLQALVFPGNSSDISRFSRQVLSPIYHHSSECSTTYTEYNKYNQTDLGSAALVSNYYKQSQCTKQFIIIFMTQTAIVTGHSIMTD